MNLDEQVNLNRSFDKPQANRVSFESAKQEFKAKLMSKTPQNSKTKQILQLVKIEEPKQKVEDALLDEEKIEVHSNPINQKVNVSILENDDEDQKVNFDEEKDASMQIQEDSIDDDQSVHSMQLIKKESKFKGLTIQTEEDSK